MELLAPITEDGINERFPSIVWYGHKYFEILFVDLLEFWSKIFKLQDENPQWRKLKFLTYQSKLSTSQNFKVLETEVFILSIKMPSSIVFISAKMVFF